MKENDEITKPYRPCVVAVFLNASKQVLVGLRKDENAWQFPQGGVEPGEPIERALFREVREEIGSDDFKIVRKALTTVKYDFPKTLDTFLSKRFRGQEQSWFLCEFNPGFGPDLAQSTCDEFSKTKWTSPEEVASNIIEWKKESYKQGLHMLGLL